MFVIHGIGSEVEIFSKNVLRFQESYKEVTSRIFPDVPFATEFMVCHWREKLKDLDVRSKPPIVPRWNRFNVFRFPKIHWLMISLESYFILHSDP